MNLQVGMHGSLELQWLAGRGIWRFSVQLIGFRV